MLRKDDQTPTALQSAVGTYIAVERQYGALQRSEHLPLCCLRSAHAAPDVSGHTRQQLRAPRAPVSSNLKVTSQLRDPIGGKDISSRCSDRSKGYVPNVESSAASVTTIHRIISYPLALRREI